MKKVLIILICTLTLSATVNAGLVSVDAGNHIYSTGTQAGGDLLYWYMDLQQSAAGSGATRSDQLAFAGDLSLTGVAGIGTMDNWRMADVADIDVLFGQAVVNPVLDRFGKPTYEKDGTPITETTYPNALVQDIYDAVVAPTGWTDSLGHFFGRYTDPSNPTAMIGLEVPMFSSSWSVASTLSTPDYTSHDYQGAWIVAVPEPATICLLGLGGLLLRKRKSA